ncbi:hypothetical protein Tco_0026384 [Tanacetum coccineum]
MLGLFDCALASLHSKVHVHVHDYEETLEDAEKSRSNMKDKQDDKKFQEKKVKMFPIDYRSLNHLYETFVPQKEVYVEQKYFSETSTSNVCLQKESVHISRSPPQKMPKQHRFQKYFAEVKYDIRRLKLIFATRTPSNDRSLLTGNDDELKSLCYKEVKSVNEHLRAFVPMFESDYTMEVKEMLNIFESIESELLEITMEK